MRRFAGTCLCTLALCAAATWRDRGAAQDGTVRPVFGPKQYFRSASVRDQFEERFTIPSSLRPPYSIHILNGDSRGHRVTSATLTLNGVDIATARTFSQKNDAFDLPVTLAANNVLRVTLTSARGSCLTISVHGSHSGGDDDRDHHEALVVDAGPDQTIVLPASATLAGSVKETDPPHHRHWDDDRWWDDDRGRDDRAGDARRDSYGDRDHDEESPAIRWTKVSGPGTVSFADASKAKTIASFSAAGTYVLRLTASEKERSASDDVTITVKPAATNVAPVVNAGANQTITLPAAASLSGTASDDGLPVGSTLTTAWTKVSGPGTVTFANAASSTTTATFDQPGTYVLRLTASDSVLTSASDVTITVNPAPPTNQPPTVNAGANQTITLPAIASLSGTATDDGLPVGSTLTTTWSKVSGPGGVTFASATSSSTTATFDQPGSYVLRLTASDSVFTRTSDVTITVSPAPPTNQPPTVNAGANQTITLPAAASLSGTATDDGLPVGSTLTTTWSKVSGPGGVTFASATSLSTTATFDQPGSYVLRLTATDTLLTTTSDVTITVNPTPPTNQPPTVNAGANQTITLPSSASLSGTASDDGLPVGSTLTTTWSRVSGPGAVTFASATSLSTTATFDRPGTYVLRLTATDTLLTATSDVTITVNPAPPTNQPPTVDAGTNQTITLPAAASLSGTATDDGLPVGSTLMTTWSKVSGPGAVMFANAAILKTTAAFDQSGSYVLRLTANDSVFTTTSDITITVNPAPPTNHSPSARAGGPYAGATGQAIAFDGSASSDPDNDPLTYSWDFGDGTTGSGQRPSHTYSIADRFTVTLTVRDDKGASNAATVLATVAQTNRPPIARAGGPYSGDAGSPIALSAAGSIDPDGDTLAFAWNYGDGGTGSGPTPTHAYAAAGVFTVTLTVADGRGGTNAATTSATIGPPADRSPPVVHLSAPKTALPGTQATATADATDNVGVSSVTIDVEGTPVVQTTPPYRRTIDIPALARPGSTMRVRATARDAAGNTGADETVITIVAEPDTTPPTVSIQVPPQAAAGASVLVTASAQDNVGVKSVKFSIAGQTLGSSATPPYQTSYLIPAGTPTGATLTFVAEALDFSNNSGTSSGALAIVAVPDTTPPTVALTAPVTVIEGGTMHLSAAAADNVRVASVALVVDGVVVRTFTEAPYALDFVVPATRPAGSVLHAQAIATDSSGNQAADDGDTRVTAAASFGTGTIAGEVYDDTTSLPLQGAIVSIGGHDQAGHDYNGTTTTGSHGEYTLTAATGTASLQITRPGWTRVDRTVAIADHTATLAFDARLTPFLAQTQAVSAIIGGALTSGSATLTIAPGALASDTTLTLATIGPQGIEGMLPIGWSPVAGVDIWPHGVEFSGPQTISAATSAPAPSLVLARWDEAAEAWRAVGAAAASTSSFASGAVTTSGQYVWLAADSTPAAPPDAIADALIGSAPAVTVPDAATIAIAPKPKILFYQPGVSSKVGSVLSAGSPLPSGTPLRSTLSESYQFTSRAEVVPERFVEDFVFYQRPGPSASLSASFTVTPSRTFDPLDLKQGVITVELRAPAEDRTGPTVGADGGTVTALTGESLEIPAGSFASMAPVGIVQLTAGALGLTLPDTTSFIGGATIGFSGAAFTGQAVLSVPRPADVDSTTPILLVRLVDVDGATRLVLAGVGRVIGTRIVSDRSITGVAATLDGVNAAGRYAFVRGFSGTGFVTGTVVASNGASLGGALVTTSGLPIIALSDAAGRYVVPAAVGSSSVTAKDLRKLDITSLQASVGSAGAVVAADVRLAALSLAVTALTPADGASSVALSTAVVVTFSEPIDAATLAGASGANILVAAADGSAVNGALSLSQGNTKATFRPGAPLSPNSVYTVTVGAGIKDPAGRGLASAVVTHFTSLDTTPPPTPPAGSITATIPDAGGFTNVTATQGTAGVHDSVSIINVTKRTSFPALVDANGGFTARFAVQLGDKLQVAITDPAGNQTSVPLPPFARVNADGSRSMVVGSEGGHVEGPQGIGVDVPAGSLPDGTVVTVGAIDEASFPIALTDDQRKVFSYAGGLRLDFAGVTPSKYVNVSIPARPDDPSDGEHHWIVNQVVTVGDRQVLNVVDTARIIDGRVATSSAPCPGVQSSGTYNFVRAPAASPIAVVYGRFSRTDNSIQQLSMSQSFGFGAGASSFTMPGSVLATPSNVDMCVPVLSGLITVQPNVQHISIDADKLTPADREVVVLNQMSGREFHFPRNVVEYRFLVDGSVKNKFTVTIDSNGVQLPAIFKVSAGPTPGFVNIVLDMSKLTFTVSAVTVQNVTSGNTQTFKQADVPFTVPVEGSVTDSYFVTIVDATGFGRAVPSSAGPLPALPGNLVLRARPFTIDPNAEVEFTRIDGHDPKNITTTSTFVPANLIVDGGFTYVFDGNPAVETYYVTERVNGEIVATVAIPRVAITISMTATGQVLGKFNVPVPPPDEPINLGRIPGDVKAPRLLSTPRLTGLDPGAFLTFTFSEGIDTTSARNGITLLDGAGNPVSGQVRVTNKNRTLTFVPDAPLRMNARYSLVLSGLSDESGNVMKRRTFAVTTAGPSVAGLGPSALNLLEWLTLVKKATPTGDKTYGFAVMPDSSAAGGATMHWLRILDLTIATQPTVLSSIPMSDGGRVTVLQSIDIPLHAENTCPPGGTRFRGDLAIVSNRTVGTGSAVQFYDVSNLTAPCQIGSKLLTINPALVGASGSQTPDAGGGDVLNGGVSTVRADGAVRSISAIPRTIVALSSDNRLKAYIAVENTGLMMVDVGNFSPTIVPDAAHPTASEYLEPMASGSYTDVAVTNGLLLSTENTNVTLDLFTPSLGLVWSADLPQLKTANSLAYASNVPFDLNGDAQIGQDEVRNVAFVGGVGGIQIVDVTDAYAPQTLGAIPLKAKIYQLDFDPQTRRLYAGGTMLVVSGGQVVEGEYTLFLIDLNSVDPFTPIDKDFDGEDDRIAWRTSPGTYADAATPRRAVRLDGDTGALYAGNAQSSYDVFRFDTNLTGFATFTFFPLKPPDTTAGDPGGIDYANGGPSAIRGAIVELRNAAGKVLERTNTDDTGAYALHAPVGAAVEIVVRAALGIAGSESVKVVDNTNGNTVWEKSTGQFLMSAKKTVNIYAETVWNAASSHYTKREAAPFAILDDAYQAQQTILQADPTRVFRLINMAWSPKNFPNSTDFTPSVGHIGTGAQFIPSCSANERTTTPNGRFCLGKPDEGTLYLDGLENNDTDEYDQLVVLHEWSHYFQAAYGRDDSVGNEHTSNLFLDPTLSFSEGFATAFAAMLTNNPWYIDTTNRNQIAALAVNLERDNYRFGGYFKEQSVQELIWDLYDGVSVEDDAETGGTVADMVELGFEPIYDAVVNGVKNTPAFTTIYAFLAHLMKRYASNWILNAAVGRGIEALAVGENIDADTADDFEQSIITDVGTLPLPFSLVQVGPYYTRLPMGTLVSTFDPGTIWGGQPLRTDVRFDIINAANRWLEFVYFKFDIATEGDYRITVKPIDPAGIFLQANDKGSLTGGFTPVNSTQVLDGHYAPGTYSARVTTYGLAGTQRVPAAARFTIRIDPK